MKSKLITTKFRIKYSLNMLERMYAWEIDFTK